MSANYRPIKFNLRSGDIKLTMKTLDLGSGGGGSTTNGAVVARGTYDTAETTGASTPKLPMMNVVGCTDLGVLPQASPPFPAWVPSIYYESWTYHVELAIRLSDSATAMLNPLWVPAGAGVGSWIFIDNTTSPTVSYLDIQMGTSPALPGTYHFGFSFIVTDVGSV